MRVTMEIGESYSFVLKQALLVYQNETSERQQFVTLHDVIGQGDQPPQLGPGRLLNTAFLRELARGLEQKTRAAILPSCVLVSTGDVLVWWTPPRLHRMYFSEGAEDRREVHGRICPHPALVWMVRYGHLYMRALAGSERPTADAPLMIAPYWNTEPTRGEVCQGDMQRPRETDVSRMLEWEEGFYNSHFTHPSGVGKLTTHGGGFMGLWTELAGKNDFPSKYLAPSRQTLQQFVGEAA